MTRPAPAEAPVETVPSAPALTLNKGQFAASFKELDWNGVTQVRFLAEQQRQELLNQFPDLKKLMEQVPAPSAAVQQNHPDWPSYNSQYEQRVDYVPWLVAANAADAPMTLEIVFNSRPSEIKACMLAIADLNPDSIYEMPPMIRVLWEQEQRKKAADRPNR